MKKLLIHIVLLLLPLSVLGQSGYGNEWINYDQQYLKIRIVNDGIYRIDSAELADAFATIGQNLSSVDPRLIQIYGREKQIPIYINGESDGVFNNGDFIEFRGQKNDGWYDTQMYDFPVHHANPYFSFYNDTATYYLTVDKIGVPGERMIIETDTNYNNYPQADYFWFTSWWENHNRYYSGEARVQISLPRITAGEGWFDPNFTSTNSGNLRTRTAPTPNPYTNGPDGTLTTAFATTNDPTTVPDGMLNQDIAVEFNGQIVFDTLFKGYKYFNQTYTVPANNMTSTTSIKWINTTAANNTASAKGAMAIAHVTVRYPHNLSLGGATEHLIELPADTTGAGKVYLSLINFNGNSPVLYSEIDGAMRRIPVIQSGTTIHAVVPNSSGATTHCYLYDEGDMTNIASTEMLPVTSNNGYFTDYSLNAPDSAFIFITHKDHWNEVNQYAAYRSTTGHNPVVVDVDELYHQFGAGIVKHPEGIKDFLDHAYDNWNTPPQYVYLVGKSVRAMGQPNINDGSRKNAATFAMNKVPSYGYPCSDLLYVTDLDNDNDLAPEIAIGRLSVETNQDILDYLSKVQQHDALGNEEWRKNILHFGGGANAFEQNSFRLYLQTFEQIIEDTLMGAKVHTFLKESSAPIEINLSDSVRNLIEGGVTMMTFFGHASGQGFDQNIDDPQNYDWNGKYPFLLGNSCYSGDIHEPDYSSTSEDYTLIQDKGVIGFLSSVKQGLDVYLYLYSQHFYRNMAYRSYGQSVGHIIMNTLGDFDGGNGYTWQEENVATSMNLHGDPAIVLYSPELPDFDIQVNDINFNPGTITADVDSFDVHIEITNIGKAYPDSVVVELIRHFPNGEMEEYQQTIYGINYQKTVTFPLPTDKIKGLGLNRFDVNVDIPSYVTELPGTEIDNNTVAGVELFILTGGIVPVYPYQYAIVPDSIITLKGSTGNLWAAPTDFIFEIDTTDAFNSPFKISEVVNHPGGVVNWVPRRQNGDTLILTDSTVYFWRVTADTFWRESSFQYINGRHGWGQAHYFQFKNNDYSKIKYNRTLTNRSYDFLQIQKTISCLTRGWDINDFETNDFEQTGYSIDGAVQDEHGCNYLDPCFHVVIIDSATLEPWRTYGWVDNNTATFINADHQFGNANNGIACNAPRNRTEGYFVYRMGNAGQMQWMDSLLNHIIPDGNYVMVYTWTYLVKDRVTQNGPDLYNTMANLGATSFNNPAMDSVPYIFFAKKGDPSSAMESFGTGRYDHVTLQAIMTANHPFGSVKSEVAGPAASWDALHWEHYPTEQVSSDSTIIRLYARNHVGVDSLVGSYNAQLDSVTNLGTMIDAATHPYARIEMYSYDDSTATPSYIDRWQLVYTPVPEAALNPPAGYSWAIDSVQEGDSLHFAIAIENISAFDMDSLLVHYWIEDRNNQRHYLNYPRQAPLLNGEVLYDTISISTTDFPGTNFLWVEVNPVPQGTTGAYDQPEQFHFNNIAVRSFTVGEDRINPILDVTFDGIHIIDGEVVSSKPMINITLDDENPFLIMDAMTDTANFSVWLTDPDGNQKRIYFMNGQSDVMYFTPAGADNVSRIEYNPVLTKDGVYSLLVQAQDKSDNQSGNIDYTINFEIITASTVTEVLNYPNPFSTKTHFVFTLTGSEVPAYFKIQIMTVTGRVVREIDQDELGELRIGRNMTEFAWDGTDEFGDPLANGVYLYRVIVKDNNLEDVEYRSTSASQFFKKGIGKMYLMR